MTQNQKTANIIERTYIKHADLTLYVILGSDGETKYFITVKDGKIDPETHQDCRGFHNCGYCYHVRDILALEGDKSYSEAAAQVEQEMQVQYSQAPSLNDVEQPRRVCDRCNKDAYEWREQDGETLCETCIRELNRNAGIFYDPAWYPKSLGGTR